jgi:hypothetical protein
MKCRRLRWVGLGGGIQAEKSPGKRLVGTWRSWEDRITMDLTETLCDDGLWTKLPRDRVQWWTLVLVALNRRVLLLSECPVKMSLQLFIFLIPLNVGNTKCGKAYQLAVRHSHWNLQLTKVFGGLVKLRASQAGSQRSYVYSGQKHKNTSETDHTDT